MSSNPFKNPLILMNLEQESKTSKNNQMNPGVINFSESKYRKPYQEELTMDSRKEQSRPDFILTPTGQPIFLNDKFFMATPVIKKEN